MMTFSPHQHQRQLALNTPKYSTEDSIEMADILFIEDNEADQFLLELFVKEYFPHLRIKFLVNGEQTLHYFFGNKTSLEIKEIEIPRLIFMDLNLPRIHGLDLLKNFQNHPKRDQMIIVVNTNSASEKDIFSCYQMGVNACLQKAVDIDEYHQNLRNTLKFFLQANIKLQH